MYTEEEVRQDMDQLRSHVDVLRAKYGEDFSSIIAAGVKIDEYWAGTCMIGGESTGFHQACHALLQCSKFIDEFFDACKCVLHDNDKPEVVQKLLEMSIESLKKSLIIKTDEFQKAKAEFDAEESVKKFLHDTGFAN